MKILFISLGCDKNLVDSEVMLGLLASRGYEMIDDEQEADIIVVNTCCFIHDAKQESVDNILEMAEYKKTGKLKALIVTGCLAERYRQEIIDEIPEVDAKLLQLALNMGGKVVTNDYNLNKVASIKGVSVLNINELANTLKPVVLPGEEMVLTPVREGKENSQALAYLDDGTMIVVEGGKRHIGREITTVVTSVLQTSAGRMIFAKPKHAN